MVWRVLLLLLLLLLLALAFDSEGWMRLDDEESRGIAIVEKTNSDAMRKRHVDIVNKRLVVLLVVEG